MRNFALLMITLLLLNNSCLCAPNFTYSTPTDYIQKNNPNSFDEKEKILFIVDYSNSMNENIDGRTKLQVALATMGEILPNIANNISMGLRIYGHRTGFTPMQSCTASQLVSPIIPNNAANIYTQLSSINAVGWTPITYSLKQAAYGDFGTDTTSKKRIILISDGGENCDESPCDFIINLMQTRNDIRIDVIALAIGDQDANNQLKCVALVTSGKFYTANTASELKKSLEDSLNLQKEVQAEIVGQ